MGYTMIQAKSCSYGGTRSLMAPLYIVIHYTGNDNDTAKANCNFFRYTNTRSAGAHFFVDRSGNVIQSIPLNRIAWSVGGFFTQKNGAGSLYKRCANTNSVSIELCDVKSKYPSDAQIKAVRELIKYIWKQCPNAKTIVRHWDVNGKACPVRMTGTGNSEWTKFKAAITSGASRGGSSSSANTSSASTKKGYTGDFPTLPIRGYYKKGDGYETLTSAAIAIQIKRVQSFLNWAVGSGLTVDGDYGEKTAAACIKFQKVVGITADGQFGKNTLAKAKTYKK